MKLVWTILILISMPLAVSCRHAEVPGATDEVKPPAVTVETRYQAMDCFSDRIEPHVRWLDSPSKLRQFWEAQHQRHLGGTLPVMPEVDFANHGVLWIHMGRQPTGGYTLELAEPPSRVVDQRLSIYVNWITPADGAAVIQMVTAPCMLLELSKGDYRSIAVVDQRGSVKASVDIPNTQN